MDVSALQSLLAPLGPLASVIAVIYFFLHRDAKEAVKASESARDTERTTAQAALISSFNSRIDEARLYLTETAASRQAIDANRIAIETLASIVRDRREPT